MGYLVDENGTVESQEKYIRRMSGLMRLFSAIIVAYPKLWDPFGITNAIDWLVAWLDQGNSLRVYLFYYIRLTLQKKWLFLKFQNQL